MKYCEDEDWSTCNVEGCFNPSHNIGEGKSRGICYDHHLRNMKGLLHKSRCVNADGHLGFKCLTNWTIVDELILSGAIDESFIVPHRDHIIPKALGGLNYHENIQELCRWCHHLKSKINGDYKNGSPSNSKAQFTSDFIE